MNNSNLIDEIFNLSKTQNISSSEEKNYELSRLSSFIDIIINNHVQGFLYYTLPIWTYDNKNEGRWHGFYPSRFKDNETKEKYNQNIFLNLSKFSFSTFLSQQVKNVPLFIEIHFRDQAPNSIVNEQKHDTLEIYFSSSLSREMFIKALSHQIDLKQDFEENKEEIFGYFFDFLLVYIKTFVGITKVFFVSGNIFQNQNGRNCYGGLVLALENENDKIIEQMPLLSIAINLKFREIAVQDWTQKTNRDISKQATKSAKAAIMSRNMSHNLGSHVMSHLKNKLNSVSDIVSNQSLRELSHATDLISLKNELNKLSSTKDLELPFLVGLGRFINYLQERQDYIATVATNYIPFNTTVSFKDFIYDELKPDLRYSRHHGDQGIVGRKPENILLNYIAHSEGYEYSKMIKIYFGNFDGESPKTEEETKDFDKLRKLDLAIPGGVTGRQAFFSILENIIRNAAKHSNKNIEKSLPVVIDVVEESSFSELFDNDLLKKYQNAKDKYYILTITNQLKNRITDIDIIKKGLESPYVDDLTGQMIEDYKGIKEIRISAAWLRGYSIDEDIEKDEPPAVYVRSVNREDEECEIQYIICLPKPHKVVLVFEWFPTYKELEINQEGKPDYKIIKEKIAEHGWGICLADDFEDLFEDYEMVVAQNELVKQKIRKYVPARTISGIDKTVLSKIIELQQIEDIADELTKLQSYFYEKWILEEFGIDKNNFPKIRIADKTICSDLEKQGEALGDNNQDRIILTSNGDDNHFENNIVFLTHYKGFFAESDSSESAISFLKKLNNAMFIEGITGNNSTDRIIRKNEWNDEWYYKLIAASLAKVAIFDERIFNYVAPKQLGKTEKIINLDQIEKLELNEFFTELKNVEEKLKDYGKTPDEIAVLRQCIIKFYDKKEKDHVLNDFLNNQVSDLYILDKVQANCEKRIWFFNLEFAGEYNPVKIRGYNHSFKDVSLHPDKNAAIKLLGKIENMGTKEAPCLVMNINEEAFLNAFDFICIHQGLLDKVYSNFNIKNDIDKKMEFTRIFHQKLYKVKGVDNLIDISETKAPQSKCTFLPNFIIHSGRSKPSENDMPQKQPFIQFATIENAVKDCKMTLMELLYSAHYEKNNSNN